MYEDYPRTDKYKIKNVHGIYREWYVPGMRRSKYYGSETFNGSGVVQVFNLTPTDRDLPPEEEAVPTLVETEIGNGCTKTVMDKEIEEVTEMCPECDVAGVKNPHTGERFCPDCGIVLEGRKMVRTHRAAGRYLEK